MSNAEETRRGGACFAANQSKCQANVTRKRWTWWMGKSCIRFKKPEKIPFKLFGELMSKMTVKDWIEKYESVLKKSKTKK